MQRSELVAFLCADGSLLKSAGLSPALQQLVRDMNEDTWFSLDGSAKVTGMFGGCRLGEPIADLVFVFMFGKVLREVRNVVMETEFGWTLRCDENQYVEARTPGHTAQETEEAYAEDCVYVIRHEDPEKLLAAVRFATEGFCKAAEKQGSQSISVRRRRRLCWFSGGLAKTVNTIHPDTEIHEQMTMTNGYGKVCTTTSTPSTSVRPLWTIT